ncbi:MAG TPA: hypothetical protein VFG23_05290 [Polyangia bacterium]|nr:hypothetical protein [Polyangia bacterium]
MEVRLIRWLPRGRWAFLAIAGATLPLACHLGIDAPGVPLYPNAATARLPRDQIAQVSGPIEKIDGQEVVDRGGRFELLPGCHVVELDRRMVADGNTLSGGMYWTGQFPNTIYALHLKPGARYEIRRDIFADGQTGRLVLSATETTAEGATTDLFPAKSAEEIRSCR